jgi:predicted molibdopterin-dependent oxidoreductase YjgC
MGTLFADDIVSDQQESGSEVSISIDGTSVTASTGELLVEVVLRHNEIPHICYHSLFAHAMR